MRFPRRSRARCASGLRKMLLDEKPEVDGRVIFCSAFLGTRERLLC